MKLKINKSFMIVLCLLLFVLSIGVTALTTGKFAQAFILTDSAFVGRFDVLVTPSEEFITEQGVSLFEYYFLSDGEVKGLNFEVENNGETDVICIPQVSGDINYRIFVSGKEQTEFIVRVKETVNFQLLLGTDGLDANIKNAEFFIDIQQVEGG